MPRRAAQTCKEPTCPNTRPCPVHDVQRQRVDTRPSAAARGYGSAWRKKRDAFLAKNPTCVDCGAPSTVPDHYPVTRAELVKQGVADPDDERYLVARCASCHSRKTVLSDGALRPRMGGD